MARLMIRNFLEWASGRRWRVTGTYDDIDDVPEVLKSREIAVVVAPKFVKWIIFDCPCRTGHRIMVNADPSRKPTWSLRARLPASVAPSIDYEDHERRCHYWIRNGRTHWTKDSD
jgi:hypothetical protein